MTRAHIDVVITLSLEEAAALFGHLGDNLPDGDAGHRSEQDELLVDIHNALKPVLDQAEKVLAV